MTDRKWLFNDVPNTMVITLNNILKNESPILYVSHDKEDGMWQFLDGSNVIETENASIVSLKQIVEVVDPTVIDIADLPLGWIATRDSKDGEWCKKKR